MFHSNHYFSFLLKLSNYFNPIIQIFISGLLLICLLIMIRRLIGWVLSLKTKTTILELTPLNQAEFTSSKELFSIFHNLLSRQDISQKLYGRRSYLSLEIVSSREEGIRFLLRVSKLDVDIFYNLIGAYTPEITVKEINMPFKSYKWHKQIVKIIKFKLTSHFIHPINFELDKEKDSLSYLTSSMTKLETQELMSLQFLITPINNLTIKFLQLRLNRSQTVPLIYQRRGLIKFIFLKSLVLMLLPLKIISFVIKEMFLGINYKDNSKYLSVKTVSANDHLLMSRAQEKLAQPLFRVNMRCIIVANSKMNQQKRLKNLQSSLNIFNFNNVQALKKCYFLQLPKIRELFFVNGWPSLLNVRSLVLGSDELSALFCFPKAKIRSSHNLLTSFSSQLPAPLSLKSTKVNNQVIIGVNNYQGQITPIGLSPEDRAKHLLIIGGTGNGKSSMLFDLILQDLKNGQGIAVIDPHGDLAEKILKNIPKNRINDVIYFNPDDLEYPIGLNLLEIDPDITGQELLRQRDLVTESIISIFRKTFSDDDSGGHRIEYILRNTIQTALTIPEATLFTIYDLLNDLSYRKSIVNNLQDKNLRNFWWNEVGRAGDYQRVKMTSGITAKIGRFLFSASARQIISQSKSTIDFKDIINSQKILICNLSKGRLGDDTSSLFGTMILAKLQIAVLNRASQQAKDRYPFYLYVDEFQNFATSSFVQLLSEARKYKLYLAMAEQSTSQQSDVRTVQVIMANVGSLVCFRTANAEDERILLPMLSPYVQPGDLANLDPYKFIIRLSATKTQEALTGTTMKPRVDKKEQEQIYLQVIKASREQYVRPVKSLSVSSQKKSSESLKLPIKKFKVYKVPSLK